MIPLLLARTQQQRIAGYFRKEDCGVTVRVKPLMNREIE
jgi:hypothetical protein